MGQRGDNFSSSHQALFFVLFLRRIYVSMSASFRLSVRGYKCILDSTLSHSCPVLRLFGTLEKFISAYYLKRRNQSISQCHHFGDVDACNMLQMHALSIACDNWLRILVRLTDMQSYLCSFHVLMFSHPMVFRDR